MIDRYRRSFVLPNYTPRDWWECDVFEITKAGYFVEYEIKISRNDFKADSRKSDKGVSWFTNEFQHLNRPERNKHADLELRSGKGPSRFWFVVPDGLVKEDEVPEWAGLLYIDRHVSCIKSAPLLHRIKPDGGIRAHAESVCYWRMHSLLLHKKMLTADTNGDLISPVKSETTL